MGDNYVEIDVELDTKSFDAQIKQVEEELKAVEYELKNANKNKLTSVEVKKYSSEAEKLKNKLIALREKQSAINNEGYTPVVEDIDRMGNSLNGIIRKVGKWAIAVFGVRSAYQGVKSAISIISQYDEQTANDIEFIRYMLASSLKPIVDKIVSAAYYLLGIINQIGITLFNFSLFSSETAKNFKKASAGAKDIKKSLAGFDEMNVLTDSKSGGAGADLGDITEGSKKLEEANEKAKKSIEEVKTNYNEMVKLVNKPGLFTKAYGEWGLFVNGIVRFIVGIQQTFKGIYEVVYGVIEMIVGLFEQDEEKITHGVDTFIKGLGDLFFGLINLILGPIETAVGAIFGIFRSLLNWLYETIIAPIGNFFSGLWDKISSGAGTTINVIKSFFSGIPTFFNNIITKIKAAFGAIATKVGDAISSAFKTAVNGVLKGAETILNAPIKAINKLLDTVNKYTPVKISKLSTFSFPKLAKGGIVNMPGSGVMVGSAIAGERGAEGVIPLTDSQQMAILGEAIGRYITINANITNTMNGRVLSREIQKIQNNTDFATNR